MASPAECRSALETLATRLAGADGGTRAKASFDRTLSCRLTDLDTAFAGRLRDGSLLDIEEVASDSARNAQVKLTMTGDDLLALVAGELNLARAWASGRIRVDAGVMDLVRLRSLF